YDRDPERESDLWELPLAVMDTTLFTHLGLDDDAAAATLRDVVAAARAVGGCAVVLWHSAMDADPAWTRRLAILDRVIAEARADGAAVGPLRALAEAWNGGPLAG